MIEKVKKIAIKNFQRKKDRKSLAAFFQGQKKFIG